MRKVQPYPAFLVFLAALVLALPLSISAQNREKFVISARAGGVNAVTGRTSMRPHGNTEWRQLTIKEDLETGDIVKTESDGRVELLLNPGSYMRVGENSEFELADSSLDNLEVRLLQGTAILEVTGADDADLFIGITTPHTKMSIVRRGLYRVNVVPDDGTELIVRKGRVMLEDSHTRVKGGDKVVFSGGSFSVAKVEKSKNKDGLEVWSKERAQLLAKANQQISDRQMRTIATSFSSDWSYSNSFFRRTGFWLYSPISRCYTFIPTYLGWDSPYGNSYYSSLAGGCGCRNLWDPGYNPRGYVTYPTTSGSGGSGVIGGGSGTGSSPGGSVVPGSDSPIMRHGKPEISSDGDGPARRRPLRE